MADLKPCPFCGESLVLYQPRREGDDFYQHPTSECFLATLGPGEPVVVFDAPAERDRWNTRGVGASTEGQPK